MQVAKKAVLAYVFVPPPDLLQSPECLRRFKLDFCLVSRWNPTRTRDL